MLLKVPPRDASTYHDQGEGNHDPSQQLVGDGVLPEWIPDGLVVAEEAPLEGVVLRGEDEERKPNCSEGGGGKKADNNFNTGNTSVVYMIRHAQEPQQTTKQDLKCMTL